MGSILSEPVTAKKTSQGEAADILFASSSMQGWRVTMEDAHAVIPHVADGHSQPVGYFAVYDGHGGDRVAKITGDRLHAKVVETDAFQKGQYKDALIRGFLAMDEELLADPEMRNDFSGCTAVVCLLTQDKAYVGNAGDSRCVISTRGQAVAMSFDHKPTDEPERERIEAAGGFVDYGRVNGNLALSRAIGDFEYKQNVDLEPAKQVVTAFPDVRDKSLSEDDEFIVLACDGIWDCMTNQQVVDFVRQRVAEGMDLGAICEEMCDHCLAAEAAGGTVGCDNMTVVIVGLLKGATVEEWRQRCASSAVSSDEHIATKDSSFTASTANKDKQQPSSNSRSMKNDNKEMKANPANAIIEDAARS